MQLLDLVRLEKAAVDQGFDLSPKEEAGWLLCRSTQFPERVWIRALGDDQFLLASDSARLMRELGYKNDVVDANSYGLAGTAGAIEVNSYGAFYGILGRLSALARSLPSRVAERFAAKTKSFPKSTEGERLVVQRIGQNLFREALIDYWEGRCAVPACQSSHYYAPPTSSLGQLVATTRKGWTSTTACCCRHISMPSLMAAG